MERLILVFAIFWGSSISQTLQNFDIILTADERRVLISHLDLDDLSDIFLTKRQRLAVQEEKYLRSEGFESFSEKSDGLQIKNISTFKSFGVKSDEKGSDTLFEDPNASLTFPFSKLKPNSLNGLTPADQGISPFPTPINNIEGNRIAGLQVFAATPNPALNNIQNQDSGEFSLKVNFNQQQSQQQNVDPKINIEVLLNKLTKQQQDKFLAQFSQLNFEQQTYAYDQFLRTPPETQLFALNQFLSLDPQVLIVSIQTELNSEPTFSGQTQTNSVSQNKPRLPNSLAQPQQQFFTQAQPTRNSPLTQIDQNRFQTNFLNSNSPAIQSKTLGLSQQVQLRKPVPPRTPFSKDPRNIPLTFFPQTSQPRSGDSQLPSSEQVKVNIFQTDFVKRH